MNCEKCGQPHKRCNGHNNSGAPCGAYPPRGAPVCRVHGLNGRVRAAARRQQAEVEAREQLAKRGVAAVKDPLTALAEITGEVVAWKDTIATRVNELTSIRYSTEGGEQLRAEVALFERALDRCEKFLTSMARLDIDERLARLDEQMAGLVQQVIEGVLADLGVPLEEARPHVTRRLRAVSSG